MKKLFLFIFVFLFMVSFVWSDTTTIDFETEGAGYTPSETEGTGFTDVFNRTNPDIGGNSSYLWAVEDITLINPSLTLDQISVTGASSFTFSVDLLAHHYNDWDNTDEVLITYSIDGGENQNLMWVQSITDPGSSYNEPAALDTNFDGDGECDYVLPSLTLGTGALGCVVSSSVFETFTTSNIPLSSNSTLDITLQFNVLDGTDEGIYLDNIEITTATSGTVLDPTSFAASTFSADRIDLTWLQNGNSDNVMLAWSTDGVFGTPVDATSYPVGNSIAGGGTVLYSGSNLIYYHTPLISNTQYYYKAWSVNGSNNYSTGVTDDATTFEVEPSNHVTAFTATANGFSIVDLVWTDAIGSILPDGYLLKGSDVSAGSIIAPIDGTPESDGGLVLNVVQGTESASFSDLDAETIYYFNIYPYTNSGTAIDYKIDGTIPTDNATTGVQPATPDVFFSEYIEGSSNNKALEIYNGSGAVINLDNFRINQSSNGNGWAYQHIFPTGATLADGDVWVIITNQTDTLLYSPLDADEVLSYPSVVHHNGDDARGLEYTADGGTFWFLIDVIGVPTEDPGSGWAVAGTSNGTYNHTLVRKSAVTTGNTDWAASAGTDADDSEWLVEAQNAFDYLGTHTMGGNSLPLITNIIQTPAGDILTTTTVYVAADVTDSDGTISLVELHWGLASGSLTNTITMSGFTPGHYDTNSGIPAQSAGTTIYYEVYAEDNVPESSTSAEFEYTVVEPASTTLPYTELFDADLGACYTNSVSGATKEWYWNSNGYAYMSGYNSGETEEDWLILPAVDFDSYANETMTFDTW